MKELVDKLPSYMRQSETENVAKALAPNNFASENVSNLLNSGRKFVFIHKTVTQTPYTLRERQLWRQ